MFLITRPALSANREQVIDELWRDADPSGAINNLNQSLYFLRREIDPWYEDDVSVDYVHFQGDLVWLDPKLVRADSIEFLDAARQRQERHLDDLAEVVERYRAPFAPEFEYDEWAIGWRSRLHSTFLDLANTVITGYARASNFEAARDVASHVLQVDPVAIDVERRLIWLYASLGLVSAARAQYAHLLAAESADGFDTPSFENLVEGSLGEAG
jgi:two-component SAPR family response regulator